MNLLNRNKTSALSHTTNTKIPTVCQVSLSTAAGTEDIAFFESRPSKKSASAVHDNLVAKHSAATAASCSCTVLLLCSLVRDPQLSESWLLFTLGQVASVKDKPSGVNFVQHVHVSQANKIRKAFDSPARPRATIMESVKRRLGSRSRHRQQKARSASCTPDKRRPVSSSLASSTLFAQAQARYQENIAASIEQADTQDDIALQPIVRSKSVFAILRSSKNQSSIRNKPDSDPVTPSRSTKPNGRPIPHPSRSHDISPRSCETAVPAPQPTRVATRLSFGTEPNMNNLPPLDTNFIPRNTEPITNIYAQVCQSEQSSPYESGHNSPSQLQREIVYKSSTIHPPLALSRSQSATTAREYLQMQLFRDGFFSTESDTLLPSCMRVDECSTNYGAENARKFQGVSSQNGLVAGGQIGAGKNETLGARGEEHVPEDSQIVATGDDSNALALAIALALALHKDQKSFSSDSARTSVSTEQLTVDERLPTCHGGGDGMKGQNEILETVQCRSTDTSGSVRGDTSTVQTDQSTARISSSLLSGHFQPGIAGTKDLDSGKTAQLHENLASEAVLGPPLSKHVTTPTKSGGNNNMVSALQKASSAEIIGTDSSGSSSRDGVGSKKAEVPVAIQRSQTDMSPIDNPYRELMRSMSKTKNSSEQNFSKSQQIGGSSFQQQAGSITGSVGKSETTKAEQIRKNKQKVVPVDQTKPAKCAGCSGCIIF